MKKKVVRSRDVTFDENAVYKDKFAVDYEFAKEQHEKGKTMLEDFKEEDLARNSGSLRNVNEIDPITTKVEVRRSSKTARPPHRILPSIYYILLTEDGEPQYYSEAF